MPSLTGALPGNPPDRWRPRQRPAPIEAKRRCLEGINPVTPDADQAVVFPDIDLSIDQAVVLEIPMGIPCLSDKTEDGLFSDKTVNNPTC